MNVTISQGSLLVLQASTMDRHITSKFQIPAASLGVFMSISLIICVALYDRIIIPLASKLKGKPVRLSLKQRMATVVLGKKEILMEFSHHNNTLAEVIYV